MIVKWIQCPVLPQNRSGFARAQQAWGALGRQPGFVAQLGGWCTGRSVAGILALWVDRPSLARFMAAGHDPIVRRSQQQAMHGPCTVRILDLGTLSLNPSSRSWMPALHQARLLIVGSRCAAMEQSEAPAGLLATSTDRDATWFALCADTSRTAPLETTRVLIEPDWTVVAEVPHC